MSADIPQIALIVITPEDPINVDTGVITRLLDRAGYDTSVVALEWATPEQWGDLASGPVLGRHTTDTVDGDYVFRRYTGPGGGWVRDHDETGREQDLEEFVP